MKKMFKKFVTMAMAAAMVLGMSTVAMAGEKVGEKTIYATIDSSFENSKGYNKAAIGAWNAGTDFSSPEGNKASAAAAFETWGEKPWEMTTVSDGIFKIGVVAYDDGSETDDGVQVMLFKDGDAEYWRFALEKSGKFTAAIKNPEVKNITLVLKMDGENAVIEIKENYDPTASSNTNNNTTNNNTTTGNENKGTEAPKATDTPAADATKAPATDATQTPDANADDVTPKTADNAPIMVFVALGVVSLAGVAVALRKKMA